MFHREMGKQPIGIKEPPSIKEAGKKVLEKNLEQ